MNFKKIKEFLKTFKNMDEDIEFEQMSVEDLWDQEGQATEIVDNNAQYSLAQQILKMLEEK